MRDRDARRWRWRADRSERDAREKKHLFLSVFFRGPHARRISGAVRAQLLVTARRRVNGKNPTFVGADGFSRRTSRIARKCANFNGRSDDSKRRARHRRDAFGMRSKRMPISHRKRTTHREPPKKKPSAGMRTAFSEAALGARLRDRDQCSSSSSSSA
jgi:hypothetical protein